MRASITTHLPMIGLDHGKKILGLDAFLRNMKIVDKISEKEVEEQYTNPNLVHKRFEKVGLGLMQVKFLYNVGRRIERNQENIFRCDGTINGTQRNIFIGTGASGYSSIDNRTTWGLDTATSGDYTTYTTYQLDRTN